MTRFVPDHNGPDRNHLDRWAYQQTPLELAQHLAEKHGAAWGPEQRRRLTRHTLLELHAELHVRTKDQVHP
jgi:hypothetical protein